MRGRVDGSARGSAAPPPPPPALGVPRAKQWPGGRTYSCTEPQGTGTHEREPNDCVNEGVWGLATWICETILCCSKIYVHIYALEKYGVTVLELGTILEFRCSLPAELCLVAGNAP